MSEEKKTPSKAEQEKIFSSETGFVRYHNQIKKQLKKWIDMPEEYFNLISLWIIGSYLHKQFSAYPYLFFNAMKGSGKTRMLKIISNLAKEGKMVGSMTEAVLFRTAYNRSLCVDEIEGINSQDKNALRDLLNSAYKRGLDVERLKKVKKRGDDGVEENQEIETFKVYCPIALANIRGMENVLADRCISLIMEKSANIKIINLIENFENDDEFKKIKGGLIGLTENIDDDLNYFGSVISDWNAFIENGETSKIYDGLFQKIKQTNISGRHLELFFPLFIIADMCGNKVLDEVVKVSQEIVKKKKQQDIENNIDVQIYEFISKYPNQEFVSVSDLTLSFRQVLELGEHQNLWINPTFFGRRLRTLNLVLSDTHQGKRMVRLNIEKAKGQFAQFETPEKLNIVSSELDDIFGKGEKK